VNVQCHVLQVIQHVAIIFNNKKTAIAFECNSCFFVIFPPKSFNMKQLLTIVLLASTFLVACHTSKKAISATSTIEKRTYNDPIKSLNASRAFLLSRKKCSVLVIADKANPEKVSRYYVLQGAETKELAIPSAVINASNDFVSLQSGNDFWVLSLSDSERYKRNITTDAHLILLKGFGLAKYLDGAMNFDAFVAEINAGKHDGKFQ